MSLPFSSASAAVLMPPRRVEKRAGGRPPAPPGHGDGGGGGGGDGAGGGEAGGVGPFALGLAMTGITTLFLVLIAVWLFLRRGAPDWPLPGPADALRALWISTFFLAASSAAVERAARRARLGPARTRETLRWLAASLALGLFFLGAQAWLWTALWKAGLVPASSGYAAVFFALTGLHALHVLGGLVFLGGLALGLRGSTACGPHAPGVRLGAVYWHFMGAIWLVLFTLLVFAG